MKVGLFGFFGVGAYADDIIHDATVLALTRAGNALGVEMEFTTHLDQGDLSGLDLLIVCSGSYLGPSRIWPAMALATGTLKVPVALYGTGYRREKEPLDNDARMRTQALLMKSYFTTVRGLTTVGMLMGNNIPVNCINGHGDTGILISDVMKDVVPPTDMLPERYIAGNARCMPENEAKLVGNCITWDYLAKCYDTAIEQTDMDVVFVPLRMRPNDNDAEGIAQVITRMKHVNRTLVLPSLDAKGAFSIIKGASLVFGQRLHHSIGGFSMDIPTVPMEYQFDKMGDFLSTIYLDRLSEQYLTTDDIKQQNVDKFSALVHDGLVHDRRPSEQVDNLKVNVRSHARSILETYPDR